MKSVILVFGLFTLTLINCHSVNRRDTPEIASTTTLKPENSEEESAIGKFFEDFTTNIKKGAQKTSDAFRSGFVYVKNKLVPSDEEGINNSTTSSTTEISSPAVVIAIDDLSKVQPVSTADPTEIGNRNLFDAPAMCKENEQVGRSGDCRAAV